MNPGVRVYERQKKWCSEGWYLEGPCRIMLEIVWMYCFEKEGGCWNTGLAASLQ